MGLRRQLRLTQPADYARMRKAGKAYRHRLLLLSVLPNQLAHNRYGLVTGKRLGDAVVRNRVKRHLREALRLRHPEIATGNDLVIVAHPGVVGQPLPAIRDAVDELLRRAGLLVRPQSELQ